MHITRLRLSGFKSFLEASELHIEPGLTGIVGPNGCGKSNLLEAMRWVMGAGSAKAMRGDAMDDVIFSGAHGRPPRDHAEVKLVLDNSARNAPAQFNDDDRLEIARRIKRGAGSSYKINGKPVRAKDVQLLFADASTGANSPSLVRQGQVSELIAAKPQNRRRILEEAAGVAGLHTRRHEAELKLRATENNLERLDDAVKRAEEELASLNRQARQAERYKSLSAEIRSLEAAVAVARWKEARAAREKAAAVVQTADQTLEEAERAAAQAATLEADKAELLEPARQAQLTAAAVRVRLEAELKNLERTLEAAREEKRRLEAEQERLTADRDHEARAHEEARERLAAVEGELAGAPSDADAEAALAPLIAALETAEAERSAADQTLENLTSEIAAAKARLETARGARDAALARRDGLVRRLETARKDLAEAEAAAGKAASFEAEEQTLARCEEALGAGEKAVENAETAWNDARTARSEARAPVEATRDALQDLKAERAALERFIAADDEEIEGIVERLDAPEGLEIAIAAALGDDGQDTDDPARPSAWHGAPTPKAPLPTGAKPLSSLVKTPDALKACFSQIGLIEADQANALRAWLQPGQKLVTRAGDVYRWDGHVRRSDAGPPAAAIRLEQRNRLAAVIAALPKAEAAALKAEEGAKAADAQLAEAERALNEARKAVGPLRAAEREARDKLNRARMGSENAQRQAQHAAEQAERLTGELKAAEAELAEAEALLGEASAFDLDDPNAEAQARARANQLRQAAVAAASALADKRRQIASQREMRQRLERDQAAARERIERGETRLAEFAERLETNATALAELAARPDDDKEAREHMLEEVAKAEREQASADDRMASLLREHKDADLALRDAERAASSAREQRASALARLEGAEERYAEADKLAAEALSQKPEEAAAQGELPDIDGMEPERAEAKLEKLRRERHNLGGVNLRAEEEAEDRRKALESMLHERNDLVEAISKLRKGVQEINAQGRERMAEAFAQVHENFKALFQTLFQGGEAELRLVDSDDPLEAGLEIMACPPGKRLAAMTLMSGGEQALTAIALIFAVFLSNPSPICVLDEVDAPLDDANVDRFCRMLDEMRRRTETRFLVITHNPVSMARMDRLFGVTMPEKGVSKLVSVDLTHAEELVAA